MEGFELLCDVVNVAQLVEHRTCYPNVQIQFLAGVGVRVTDHTVLDTAQRAVKSLFIIKILRQLSCCTHSQDLRSMYEAGSAIVLWVLEPEKVVDVSRQYTHQTTDPTIIHTTIDLAENTSHYNNILI